MSSHEQIFHARHHLSAEEVAMLRDIVKAIAGEPWFVDDADERDAFAREVLSMYQRGLTLPDKLQELCTLLARKHFAASEQISAAGQTEP